MEKEFEVGHDYLLGNDGGIAVRIVGKGNGAITYHQFSPSRDVTMRLDTDDRGESIYFPEDYVDVDGVVRDCSVWRDEAIDLEPMRNANIATELGTYGKVPVHAFRTRVDMTRWMQQSRIRVEIPYLTAVALLENCEPYVAHSPEVAPVGLWVRLE